MSEGRHAGAEQHESAGDGIVRVGRWVGDAIAYAVDFF